MNANHEHRSSYRRFRNQQIARLVTVLLASTAITVFVLVEMYFQISDIWSSSELPVYFSPEAAEQLNAAFPTLSSTLGTWLAIVLGLNLLLLTVAGGFITYRLAKPLYLVSRAVQDIGDGKLHTDISLGKGADLHALASSLNLAVSKIQLMIMTLQQEIEAFESGPQQEATSPELIQMLENSKLALEYFETVELDTPELSS